jgi:hypothetical protein
MKDAPNSTYGDLKFYNDSFFKYCKTPKLVFKALAYYGSQIKISAMSMLKLKYLRSKHIST